MGGTTSQARAAVELPVTVMRAGTSKGVFLCATDLPAESDSQNDVIEHLMGDDTYQMDGLGGGHVLSSKVAVVSKSAAEDVDVDYKFVQVVPGRGVNDSISCGNMMAAVGPYAVEKGYVKASDPTTTVCVRDTNSGARACLKLETPGGHVNYGGNVVLPGCSASSSPILVQYSGLIKDHDTMWPSGSVQDQIDSVPVTIINVAVPLLIVRASDLGLSFPHHIRDLHDRKLIKGLLDLRGKFMESIGKPIEISSVSPKVALIAKAQEGGTLAVRYFTPHTPHRSLAVTGAMTLAAAAMMESGTVAYDLAVAPQRDGDKYKFILEHVAGKMELKVSFGSGGESAAMEAELVRTARLLMTGTAYLPAS